MAEPAISNDFCQGGVVEPALVPSCASLSFKSFQFSGNFVTLIALELVKDSSCKGIELSRLPNGVS